MMMSSDIAVVQKTRPTNSDQAPAAATQAVLVQSDPIPEGAQQVNGIDFNHHAGGDLTVKQMIDGMTHMGFQASAVADAVRIINDMVRAPSFLLLQMPRILLTCCRESGRMSRLGLALRSSLAIHPTSFLRDCGKRCDTWCNTNMSPPSSPPLGVSKKISSNAWGRLIWAPLRHLGPPYEQRG